MIRTPRLLVSGLGLANVGRTAARTSTRLKASQALCSCPGAALFAQAEEARASASNSRGRANKDGTGFASAEVLSGRGIDNQHPRLESDTGPMAEHRATLARALGWADEAAACGDHANALARAQTLEARNENLSEEYSRQAPRMASTG